MSQAERNAQPHFRHLRQPASGAARAAVDDYWVLQAERCRAAVEAVLPDASAEIYFNLGPLGRQVFTGSGTALRRREAWVVGPRAHTMLTAKETRDCDVVGVRLQAGAAARALGVPASELSGRLTDLDLLWGAVVSEIRDRLYATTNLSERLVIVEQFIQRRLSSQVQSLNKTDRHALLPALGCATSPSVAQVARGHGLTHRQIIDYFDQHVGLKPKQYQRVHRLRRVLHAIHATRRAPWAQLAVRCGYFDQAHLIHDFRGLTGMTPSDYERKRMGVGQGSVPYVLSAG